MKNDHFYEKIIQGGFFGYAHHQVVFDQAGEPIDFTFLEVNVMFEKLTRIEKSNLIGRRGSEVFSELAYGDFDWHCLFFKLMQRSDGDYLEQYCEPLDKWYRGYVYHSDGACFTTLFYDITEQRLLNSRYLEEEQLAQSYLDAAETILVSLDNEGRIVMLNRFGLQFFGYPSDQIIGKNWFETVLPQPEGRDQVYPVFQKIVNGDLESVKYFDNDVITASGDRRSIAWRNSYWRDGEGRIVGTLSSGMDVTDRNQTLIQLRAKQEELSKQNLLFETLLENLQSGVFMVEAPSGKPVIANNAAKRMLGRGILPETSRANLSEVYRAHKPGSTALYPVDEMPIIKGMHGEISHADNMIVERPDGTETWLEIFGSPVYNTKGELWASLVNFNDITARKLVESALIESEEKYRTLFTLLSHGVFYQAAGGLIVDANDAALNMFGLSRNQFLGKDSFDPRWKVVNENNVVLLPDQHPSMVALLGGKPVFNQVVGVYVPEMGRYNWLIVDAIPQFKPGEDKPYQVFASMQDITELKQNQLIDECRLRLLLFAESHSLAELLEETLNEAEKLTESKIGFFHFLEDDQVTILLQNWSTQTKDTYCHAEGFGQKYNLDRAGVWADCVRDRKPVIHNDYHSVAHRKGLPEGHAAIIRELVVPVNRSNKITAILGVGNKITNYVDGDVEVVAKLADLAWDIAEGKLADMALRKSEIQLKELNAQKDKFFSIIAHDLRSPFNSIIGFSDLLHEQILEKDYTGIEEYARIIHQSAQRAMDLLVNLLDWARSQVGKVEYNPAYFEMADTVREMILLLTDAALQKNIDLKMEGQGKFPVYGDKQMINTVLRNLITNAIKFTHTHGSVTVTIEKEQLEIVVAVRDNGVGIESERVDSLFQVGKSESTLGTNREKGTGLGLVLCKEFIEKHGGRLWVESIVDQGSVFSFALPWK